MLDGVCRIAEGVPVFHPVRAPTAEQLQVLLTRIMKRIMGLLTRKGYLIEEQGLTTLADCSFASMACSRPKPGPGRGLLGAPRTQR